MQLCLSCGKLNRRKKPYHCCTSDSKTIYITPNVKVVAMRLNELGLKLMNAECLTYPMSEPYDHIAIQILIDFREAYPKEVFSELPSPHWQHYYFYTTTNNFKCSGLVYAEKFVDLGFGETVEQTAEVAVNDFLTYLNNFDKQAFRAVSKLSGWPE